MNESIERNKLLTQVENELLQKKMEVDSSREYQNSQQGFWYYYDLKMDSDAPMPEPGDDVVFSYEIRNLDDEIIFSKDELGEVVYRVDKEELITGLQDGIKIMRRGEKVTFLLPQHFRQRCQQPRLLGPGLPEPFAFAAVVIDPGNFGRKHDDLTEINQYTHQQDCKNNAVKHRVGQESLG